MILMILRHIAVFIKKWKLQRQIQLKHFMIIIFMFRKYLNLEARKE